LNNLGSPSPKDRKKPRTGSKTGVEKWLVHWHPPRTKKKNEKKKRRQGNCQGKKIQKRPVVVLG